MTCCAPGVEASAEFAAKQNAYDEATLLSAARDLGNGSCQLDLGVPDVHCATCIRNIETALGDLDMVDAARVNLSTKRVRITFSPNQGNAEQLVTTLGAHGYRSFLLDGVVDDKKDAHFSMLVRALAVAGFAAGNIMLFSVSIWSGADETTRNMFHWISALIAIPAVIYAGQPFFRSAWGALRNKQLNMDVPISLAVSMALLMSIYETIIGGAHAYFDASVSLLFFLLVGRTIDHMMRERARGAVKNLTRLAPKNGVQVFEDGTRQAIAVSAIEPGMALAIAPGERFPVDAIVRGGQSELDCALVTGESVPEQAVHGTEFLAGSLNISGALTVEATQAADKSFLARMIELMEAAEGSRAGYRRIADRAAAIYAPVVHLLALAAFVGWFIVAQDWHVATLNAMAVLIITCPCALALAVPMVHIVAAGRLFESGILMKDGAALERLAKVTHVVFDKTGTLTMGRPVLQAQLLGTHEHHKIAAALATHSAHPLSRALAASGDAHFVLDGEVREVPGHGLELVTDDAIWRLGRADWCGAEAHETGEASSVWLSTNGVAVAGFSFADALRPGAVETIRQLQASGVAVSLLSGDQVGPVVAIAEQLGIDDARAGLKPENKLDIIQSLQTEGASVLMVGDGINDAPALRMADVSMAPAEAADVGKSAADFVFTRPDLGAVTLALEIARRADKLVRMNFGLAIAYNLVAIPLAVLGFVTPFVAALAMSGSSIAVTLNALRLRLPALNFRRKRSNQAPSEHSAAPLLEPAE